MWRSREAQSIRKVVVWETGRNQARKTFLPLTRMGRGWDLAAAILVSVFAPVFAPVFVAVIPPVFVAVFAVCSRSVFVAAGHLIARFRLPYCGCPT